MCSSDLNAGAGEQYVTPAVNPASPTFSSAPTDTNITPAIAQADTSNLVSPYTEAQAQLQDVSVDAQKEKGPGWLQRQWNQLSGKDLARLGIAGAGGIMGAIQSRKAAGQIGAAQQQQQALATPYQEQGRALTQAAASGALSPASAQAYQAARAQMEQQASQRGGVGAEQMATQLENFRQQLLQQQYTYGLQIAQIGDQISLGAIQTGLQLDQQLQQASQNFYTSLAAIAAGTPIKG